MRSIIYGASLETSHTIYGNTREVNTLFRKVHRTMIGTYYNTLMHVPILHSHPRVGTTAHQDMQSTDYNESIETSCTIEYSINACKYSPSFPVRFSLEKNTK